MNRKEGNPCVPEGLVAPGVADWAVPAGQTQITCPNQLGKATATSGALAANGRVNPNWQAITLQCHEVAHRPARHRLEHLGAEHGWQGQPIVLRESQDKLRLMQPCEEWEDYSDNPVDDPDAWEDICDGE